MRVGLFTDTYFPQVSGVATSIRTLKEELEKAGHEVYIFTTTDKAVKRYEDPTIIRLPSVPFVSFTDRRVAYRGLISTYKIAKQYKLDIIHTQTEFSVGMLGKMIAAALRIPAVHTYHTQYEDYVGYIANGKIIKPGMVKYIMRGYLNDLDGVICPSRIVLNLLDDYHIKIPKRVVPTGIHVAEYERDDITAEDTNALRDKLGLADDDIMLLSLSRVSYEKNIQAVLKHLPEVLSENKHVKLVIAGDGPYLKDLQQQAKELGIEDAVIFTGMVPHDETVLYYKTCDFFISASTSETQGLTYTESLASGTPVIAHGNPYLDDVIDHKMFGTLFYREDYLADAILDAIADTPPMNPKTYQEKLYDISAEHFGKSVYEFYLDVLISARNKKKEKISMTIRRKEKRSVHIARSARDLPRRVAKSTAKTSVKVLKAPGRMIQSIRDFLD